MEVSPHRESERYFAAFLATMDQSPVGSLRKWRERRPVLAGAIALAAIVIGGGPLSVLLLPVLLNVDAIHQSASMVVHGEPTVIGIIAATVLGALTYAVAYLLSFYRAWARSAFIGSLFRRLAILQNEHPLAMGLITLLILSLLVVYVAQAGDRLLGEATNAVGATV